MSSISQTPSTSQTPSDKQPEGGWAFYLSEYPEEGLVGPYTTREEAEQEAKVICPDEETSLFPLSKEQAEALARDED